MKTLPKRLLRAGLAVLLLSTAALSQPVIPMPPVFIGIDGTLVQPSNGGPLVDVIGADPPFQTEAIAFACTSNFVWLSFDTSWDFAKYSRGTTGYILPGYDSYPVFTASLFINSQQALENPLPQDFDYAINFRVEDGLVQTYLYAIDLAAGGKIMTSDDYFKDSGLIYGTQYSYPRVPFDPDPDQSLLSLAGPIAVEYLPGEGQTGHFLGTMVAGYAGWSWGLQPTESLCFIPTSTNAGTFLWATGTCANDVLVSSCWGGPIGGVPEPGSYGMMGALFLLLLLSIRQWRRQR